MNIKKTQGHAIENIIVSTGHFAFRLKKKVREQLQNVFSGTLALSSQIEKYSDVEAGKRQFVEESFQKNHLPYKMNASRGIHYAVILSLLFWFLVIYLIISFIR